MLITYQGWNNVGSYEIVQQQSLYQVCDNFEVVFLNIKEPQASIMNTESQL